MVGATLMAALAGVSFLRTQDSWFRAAGAAFIAVYFLAVMSVAVAVQAALTQV